VVNWCGKICIILKDLRDIIFGLLCLCACVCDHMPIVKKYFCNYEFYEMFVEEIRELQYIESRC